MKRTDKEPVPIFLKTTDLKEYGAHWVDWSLKEYSVGNVKAFSKDGVIAVEPTGDWLQEFQELLLLVGFATVLLSTSHPPIVGLSSLSKCDSVSPPVSDGNW
jgi:hypothetical protein